MNVKKILKFYLVLSLSMTGVFSLGYSDVFKDYFPAYYEKINEFGNDFLGSDDYKYLKKNSFASSLHATNQISVEQPKMKQKKQNFSFEIINEVGKSFAKPEDKGVKIMEYKFQTNTEELEVKEMKLKIVGISGKQFERLYISRGGGEVISEGKIDGEFVEFKNVNYELENNASGSLLFFVDLSDSFKTGDRFRLDLVNAADMKISVGSKTSELNSYYPISGPYISIAKARPVAENL